MSNIQATSRKYLGDIVCALVDNDFSPKNLADIHFCYGTKYPPRKPYHLAGCLWPVDDKLD